MRRNGSYRIRGNECYIIQGASSNVNNLTKLSNEDAADMTKEKIILEIRSGHTITIK